MLKRLIIAALALIILSSTLSASKIHPALEEQISQSDGEFQRIVIRLADRLDKQSLEQNLSLSNYSRQASHALAVRSLQEKARSTQQNLLVFLRSEYKNGTVRSYKSFWIDNLISAEVSPELIAQLANFPEVETIFPELEIEFFEPIPEDNAISQSTAGAGDNLRVIGADSMWKMGYTGQGTIACNLDTGVDGIHPALIGNYRGMFGYSHEQCWFNPIDADTFPHYFSASGSRTHGTEVMGVIVGKDDATGDTTGVAFGAQWIAAGVTDIDHQRNILSGFQWAADPDNDPSTIEDVPDVINCSWGFIGRYAHCDNYLYTVIDNAEAMGAVVVFAAGNDGSNYRTLRNPANRAENAYNSFCVGMITSDYESFTIDGMSSRGPSICNPGIIKPNVVAPGAAIRSTTTGGSYIYRSGTSLACPHVAGAVLLLRSYNPNAPVDSIKHALMHSATDIDEPGPDSAAGYGLINIPAAMELLGPNDEPNVYVKSVLYNVIQPGDTVDIVVELKNSGLGILDVGGLITESDPQIQLKGAYSDFGDMPINGVADNSSDPYRLVFSDDILNGTEKTVQLNISSSGSYSTVLPLYFMIGQPPRDTIFTHNSGTFEFSVSGTGKCGMAPGTINGDEGIGYIYPKGAVNSLYDMGILVGTDSSHVSDAVRTLFFGSSSDFEPTLEGSLVSIVPSSKSAQMTLSTFNDEIAPNPLGLEIVQKTYSYDNPIDDHIMLMVYVFMNTSDSLLSNVLFSMYADWDINIYNANIVEYDSGSATGIMMDSISLSCRGISVLNTEGLYSTYGIEFDSIKNGMADYRKWQYMSLDTLALKESMGDYSHMVTTGPFTLAPGAIDTAAFAIIAADSVSDLIDLYAPAAQVLYADFLTDVPDDPVVDPVIPREFSLAQNYPNPFNPSTVIEFALEREQPVKLEIFNILGQKVTTLIDETLPAGKHRVLWDTVDADNAPASGIYFYRLSGADQTQTRKMILLK